MSNAVMDKLEQAEREVDEFLKKQVAGNTEGQGDDEAGKTATAAPEAAATTEGDGSTEPEKTGTEAAKATKDEPQKVEAPAPVAETVPKAEYDRVVHSLSALQGKYNNEVAPLMRRVAELEKMKTAPPPAPKAEPAPKPNTAAAKKRLGESLGSEEAVDDLDSIASEKVAPLLEEINRLTKIVTDLQQTTQHVAETTYDREFYSLVPRDVKDELDADPAFHAHLLQEDGNSGKRLIDTAKEWEAKGVPDRVARVYIDYQKKIDGAAPAGTTPPPAPPKAPVKPSKAALLAPGSTPKGAAPTSGTELALVKESEMTKFANDVRSGAFRGREAEQAAIEARHTAAQAAGRIVRGQ